MRDAVGGSFMIKLLLVFLAVYVIFIAIAINYAKAFKVKNKVLDIIEQNEGIGDYDNTSDPAMIQIDEYMNNIHYGVNTSSVAGKCSGYEYVNETRGYCITEIKNNDLEIQASYYKVTTFVTIDIPLVNLSFTVPIRGETRRIEEIKT